MDLYKLDEIFEWALRLDALGLSIERFAAEDKYEWEQLSSPLAKMIREFSGNIIENADRLKDDFKPATVRLDKSILAADAAQLRTMRDKKSQLQLIEKMLGEIKRAEDGVAGAKGFIDGVRAALQEKKDNLRTAA